jgi:hypothetical protein
LMSLLLFVLFLYPFLIRRATNTHVVFVRVSVFLSSLVVSCAFIVHVVLTASGVGWVTLPLLLLFVTCSHALFVFIMLHLPIIQF